MSGSAFILSAPGFLSTSNPVKHSSHLEGRRVWRAADPRLAKTKPLFHQSTQRIIPQASIGRGDVAVILLAGGTGSRMKADCPKQFLTLAGRSVIDHSISLFSSLADLSQLVLVLDNEYREQFADLSNRLGERFAFADPGRERQDSVYNGLCAVRRDAQFVCIHDSARPLVTTESIRHVISDAREYGAAVLGVPSKATIKESADGRFVLRTIARKRLWEIQTPQVIEVALLKRGFEKVRADDLEVTDDVSIIEQLGEAVKITEGEYTNIKITTGEDMTIAESILRERD